MSDIFPDHIYAEWLAARKEMERLGIKQTMRGPAGDSTNDRMKNKYKHILANKTLRRLARASVLKIDIKHLIVGHPLLSANPYRILYITDPHFDAVPELSERILACVERAVDRHGYPHMVAHGGDNRYGHGPMQDAEWQFLSTMKKITAIARPERTVAIFGNHDRSEMAGPMRAQGITLLTNSIYPVPEAPIQIVGIDDVCRFFTQNAVYATQRPMPDGMFSLFMPHGPEPELVKLAAQTGHHLCIAGHTHGGQTCWPNGVPWFADARGHGPYLRGIWKESDMLGYTSCGAGVSTYPMRFMTRGEITMITLRYAPRASLHMA